MAERVFTVRVHSEDQAMCAEVLELPGCFASGADWDDLRAAVAEAISLYLSTPDEAVTVEVESWGAS
jgi:predicted RNase H-like HicB family nuclease